MKVELGICFFAKTEVVSKVIDVLNSKNIATSIPEFTDCDTEVLLNVDIELNGKINYECMKDLYMYLENNLQVHDIGEMFSFKYTDEEYELSPFFVLQSTGNSSRAFLDDKGTAFKEEIFCNSCGLIQQNQNSPLVIDTSKIKGRYMVNVGAYWVVSETMAELMEDWMISGYELKQVIHKGPEKGKQPAYQIVPSFTLPNWSKEMEHYYFATEEDGICSICGVKGRIDGPYYYNKKDLINMNMDVYLAAEWTHNGNYVYRKTLFSKKFRDMIIKHKISKDVRDMKKYGSKDWLFEPVILV